LWYLDSGCSKHMTSDKTLLKEVQMGKGGRITYGDGSQSKVIGKGIIDIPSLGTSQEALYVEGLKANLLSISQFCDNDLVVQFSKKECNIFDSSGRWLMGGERTADNCYGLLGLTADPQIFCNNATIDDSELWHQRLGHLNFSDMLKIAGKDVVKGLPKMEKTGKGICGPCQLGKQTRAAHKKTSGIQTSKNLELLHMDLMGPTRTASLGGKRYILVIVDDFSRYTWAIPIREKSDAFDIAQHLFKKIHVEKNCQIVRIRSDHGGEFENSKFEEFYHSYGIKQEFSSPITSQQNGVVERKNRVIQVMARVMIHSKNLSQHFWGKAVNTAYHIINRVYLRPETNKTPYEIWRGKKPIVKYFKTFGSKCYILRDRENLGKFDTKSNESIFLGYSTNSRAYRVFNKRTETVIESINVIVDDEEVQKPISGEEKQLDSVDSSAAPTDIVEPPSKESPDESPPSPTTSDTTPTTSEDEDTLANPPKRSWVKNNHPPQQLLGNIDEGRRLRSRVIQPTSEVANQVSYSCYLAQTEPKKVDEALQDEGWVSAMHDELHQFT
jgi:transposase InsO family protein